jgi:AcrR family transcriptional regulator
MSGPTSSRLLAAGAALAARYSFEQLTPENVADTTGLTREQFTAQFGSLDSYLTALNQQFLDHILDRLVNDARDTPRGLPRMCRATELQLDICLEHRALRLLLGEARRRLPGLAQAFHKRNQTAAMMIGIELKSLACPDANGVGRLYCHMVLETAQIECEAGTPNRALRRMLAEFLANALSAPPVKTAAAPARG